MRTRKAKIGRMAIGQLGILALAMVGLVLVGCSEEEEEVDPGPPPCTERADCEAGMVCEDEICVDGEPCSQRHDCDSFMLCDTEEEICIEPDGEVSCDKEADCPVDMYCENNEVCVVVEGPTQCEESDDCADGFICDDGECVPDPLGPYGDPPEEAQSEDYRVSYVADWVVGDDATTELHYVPGVGEERVMVDTGDIDCHEMHRCAISEDETHFIAVESVADGYDIYSAPIEGDPPAVQGSASRIAESVARPWIRGDGVAYERPSGGFRTGFYMTYDGTEKEVATLEALDAEPKNRSWDYHPASNVTVQFDPIGLESLDIRAENLDDGTMANAFLDGTNRPGEAGSLYLGTTRAGFSDDGRFIAYITNGPNDHEQCSTDSDCSQPGHACGSEDRCVAIEPTVHVIDMEYADTLGQPCTDHDGCGPVNRCDSATENFDQGVCEPQRIVVGLPDQSDAGHDGGCEVTRDDGSFRFTQANAPLTFGPDQRVYFVGKRDCVSSAANPDTQVEANIPRTSIVAGDLTTGEYEEIWGNFDGDDYHAVNCGSAGQLAEDDCNVYIENVRLSPGGNDLIFKATTPVASAGRATSNLDVWRVTREGEDALRIGGLSGTHSATQVRVHGDWEPMDDEEVTDEDGESDEGSDEDGEQESEE